MGIKRAAEHAMTFDQFLKPIDVSIRRQLDGHQLLRPPDIRMKLPSSEHHTRQIFIHCVAVNDQKSSLSGCAMLIARSLLLRPGKMG